MVDQVIKLKRNTTNTNAPGTSDIAVGELAIGAVAGKLYIRKSDDSILEFTDSTASSSAADDISTGDAAVTIATTSGNITIDAQANDSDIIFKGTDGGSDTTFLTLDGSAAGAATFNDKIVATELVISGDVDIDGTLEADAVTVNGTALSSVIAGTTVTLASSATALATGRTIGMTGDVVWTSASFDGSGNVTGSATIQAGAVENSMLADDAVGADELAANAVVNASVASGAAIAFSKMENLTASRALVSDANGDVSVATTTATEIGHVNGVTGAIQGQIDEKASKGFATAMAIAL